MTTRPKLPILFRISSNDKKDVYALFPTLPGTYERHTCTCYQHVGQHSSADYNWCIASSRPATPEEYSDLLKELTQIYDDSELVVYQRETPKMRNERYESLRRIQ